MKDYEKTMIEIVNSFVDDYSVEELFEEIGLGDNVGQIVVDMWNAGMVTNDAMEKFLNN